MLAALRFFLMVLFALPAAAADPSGNLNLQILDSNSQPIANTPVILIHRETASKSNFVTGPQGNLTARNLTPGQYMVTAVTVAFGSITAQLTVRAGETAALTLTPTLSSLFANDQAIPDILDIVRQTASITGGQQGGDLEGFGPHGYSSNSAMNTAGMRGQSNSFLVDGLDENQTFTRGAIRQPPPQTIQAVNAFYGYIPAAFGRAAGAIVSLHTRSGTNQFHGGAFENLRNTAFNSRNFFDGAVKSSTTLNRFGVSAGGPIQKNIWFIFGSIDVQRGKEGRTVISTVPLQVQHSGDFAADFPIFDPLTIRSIGQDVFARLPFANNRIPVTRVPAAARKLIALYPLPNLPGLVNNYRLVPAAGNDSDRFDLRSDKTGASHQLTVRLSYQSTNSSSPGAFPSGSDIFERAENATTNTKALSAVFSHSLHLRPSLVNQFRVGMTRFNLKSQPNDDGVSSINVSGFTSLGSAANVPARIQTTNLQLEDSGSWTTGHHAFQFGFQAIRRSAKGDASEESSRGTFFFTPDYTSLPGSKNATGNAFASLLLGFPSEVSRNIQFQDYQLRSGEFSGFAQDQFHWKRLTIQAGVRYSFLPPVAEANNRLVNFNFQKNTPALNQFAGQNGVNGYAGLSFNKRAFAPRIGFIAQLSHSTFVRGGFSKALDTGSYLTMGRLARNAPYASQLDIINGTFQLGDNISAGLPAPISGSLLNAISLNNSRQAVNAIEPEKFTPYADQWDLFLDHRVRDRLTLEVGLLSSMGVHLYAAYDANQPFPAPAPYATARYPFEPFHGRVNYLNLGGGSTYYGAQATLRGEITRGFQVSISYSMAKAIDDAASPGAISASRSTTPQFIYNARSNRSPSTFDVAHRAVLTASYDTRNRRQWLANWRISTLVTLQSGFPFTPELATNSLNNAGYQLPDRVADGSLPSGQRTYTHWFDTQLGSSFRVPDLYQYGNSGSGILRGPGLATVHLAFARWFKIRERLTFEPRVEAFNLLNHTNFALPHRILGLTNAGVIDHSITEARQLRLLLAFHW